MRRGHILWQFAPLGSGREGSIPTNKLMSSSALTSFPKGKTFRTVAPSINFDLTWNPIRLVQRNGRIDRIGSPHTDIVIYNLFPEDELEMLLGLVQRLTDRITTIDDLGEIP